MLSGSIFTGLSLSQIVTVELFLVGTLRTERLSRERCWVAEVLPPLPFARAIGILRFVPVQLKW
ncbi:MAG TPA: hypothetical protein VGU01_01260 [Sphingomicrobium sp.]|nr:hypothetical protein [Sphingomicrobium sp.]